MSFYQPFSRPARQIRLLQAVHSDGINSSISFSLSTVDLDQAPDFHAISYTWGPQENSKEIYIEGQTLSVRFNCHYSLQQVLSQYADSPIWIDSICINQDDEDEKSLQVAMMGDIYARAARVLVCVGEHADESEILYDFAYDLLVHHQKTNISTDPIDVPWRSWVSSLDPAYLERVAASYSAFANRSYWSRLWIVQEVSKADYWEVLCSDMAIPWYSILHLEDCFEYDFSDLETSQWAEREPSALSNVATRAEQGSIPVSQVFRTFNGFGCTDTRDRLYGL